MSEENKKYEFVPLGVSDEEEIIFDVSDGIYGDCTFAVRMLNEDEASDIPKGQLPISYSYHAVDENNKMPVEYQEKVVTDIVDYIMFQINNYTQQEEEQHNTPA